MGEYLGFEKAVEQGFAGFLKDGFRVVDKQWTDGICQSVTLQSDQVELMITYADQVFGIEIKDRKTNRIYSMREVFMTLRPDLDYNAERMRFFFSKPDTSLLQHGIVREQSIGDFADHPVMGALLGSAQLMTLYLSEVVVDGEFDRLNGQ